MARIALTVVLVLLAVAGSSAAATVPAFLLHDGQTRYLTPSEARPGTLVRCVTNGRSLDSRLGTPAAGATNGSELFVGGGAKVSINQRPNGATEIVCGSATAGSGFFRRSPDRYVIGQNGLALIRGANRLSVLERIYGAPGVVRSKPCRATWRMSGLVATFAGGECRADSVLVGAVVIDSRWRSLSGAQISEPVAKLLWDVQSAKPLSHGRWLVASGGMSRHARLVAVTSVVGTVTKLVLTGS